MPESTTNFGLNRPDEGSEEWGSPLNNNFGTLDVKMPFVDTEANRGSYSPDEGSLFLGTDTGELDYHDGTEWRQVGETVLGTNASVSSAGSTVVENPLDVNYTGGFTVTDDGDQTVTIDLKNSGGGAFLWRSGSGLRSLRGGPCLDVFEDGDAVKIEHDGVCWGFWERDNTVIKPIPTVQRQIWGLVVPKFLGNCINLRESGDSEDPERTYPMKVEDKQEETIFWLNALGSLWTSSNINAGGDIWASGDINASGEKNFVDRVDTDEGKKDVVYTSTEAPTSRTEVSGVASLANGRAEVELPEHFAWVTSEEAPIVVQTTPYGGTAGLRIVERSPERFVAEALDGEGDYEFAYTVKGTRAGHEHRQVVREPGTDAHEGAPDDVGGQHPAGSAD